MTALTEVFGTAGEVGSYRFEGKMDPLIVTELMRGAGIEEAVIERRRPEALALYLERLEAHLSATSATLKPGVRELVEHVAVSPRATVALLTGNVERGARIKLGSVGLWHHFRFGAFGDDGPRRVDLGPVALGRAAALTGRAYSGSECVVIGDSRADVECGKAIGARVVAVATGRTARAELEEAGADEALPDFADLDRTLEAIYG